MGIASCGPYTSLRNTPERALAFACCGFESTGALHRAHARIIVDGRAPHPLRNVGAERAVASISNSRGSRFCSSGMMSSSTFQSSYEPSGRKRRTVRGILRRVGGIGIDATHLQRVRFALQFYHHRCIHAAEAASAQHVSLLCLQHARRDERGCARFEAPRFEGTLSALRVCRGCAHVRTWSCTVL